MPAATCVCLSSVSRICVKILAALSLLWATWRMCNSINQLLLLQVLHYFGSLLLTLSRFHWQLELMSSPSSLRYALHCPSSWANKTFSIWSALKTELRNCDTNFDRALRELQRQVQAHTQDTHTQDCRVYIMCKYKLLLKSFKNAFAKHLELAICSTGGWHIDKCITHTTSGTKYCVVIAAVVVPHTHPHTHTRD